MEMQLLVKGKMGKARRESIYDALDHFCKASFYYYP